jgi:3',5'-cyclic AMP phosphodiesterase CpdA
MLLLAHLSDVHLAPLPRPQFHHLMNKRFLGYVNWQRRKGHHRSDVLDVIVGDMLERDPGHIAVTGDLINIALPEEFILARLWLDKLGTPETVSVVPGNHDAYSPFWSDPRLRHWRPYMISNEAGAERFGAHGLHFPYVRLYDRIALIGLSSARATLPGMASGWLGAGQMREVANILSKLGEEGYCRIVMIHHPPLPGMTSHVRGLHDAGRFKGVLTAHGAELVLHGHNHRTVQEWLPTSSKPIPIIGVSSASLLHAQPEKSASYNLFTIEEIRDRWEISMLTRRLDTTGQFQETLQSLSAGPGS